MQFGSDNWAGVSHKVSAYLSDHSSGQVAAYGGDDLTKAARDRLSDFFGTEVDVFFTATGSGANMLALSAVAKPGGVIFCGKGAHINTDEAAGPESLVGMKLHSLPGHLGRIPTPQFEDALSKYPPEAVYRGRPVALSITQGTELGTTYCAMDVAALGSIAKRNNVLLHMDGARFANALISQNVPPATLTHEAGVDLLSLGFTKNGAWACEMVVSFRPDLRDDLTYRHKQMGQVFSKNRFAAVQCLAMLENDHWKELAANANATAQRLSEGLAALPGCRLAAPTEINEVFAILPKALAEHLSAKGAIFAPWPPEVLDDPSEVGEGETLVRLVTNFATEDAAVDAFLSEAKGQKAA